MTQKKSVFQKVQLLQPFSVFGSFVLGSILTLTNLVTTSPASARIELGYQPHEWVFQENAVNLKYMTQSQADQTCRNNWNGLRSNIPSSMQPYYDKFKLRVGHVWAHRNNGHCVVNHLLFVTRNTPERVPSIWSINRKSFKITLPRL
jgi:hypothetical protein